MKLEINYPILSYHMFIQHGRHVFFTLGAIARLPLAEHPFGPIFTRTAEIIHVYLSSMHGGK